MNPIIFEFMLGSIIIIDLKSNCSFERGNKYRVQITNKIFLIQKDNFFQKVKKFKICIFFFSTFRPNVLKVDNTNLSYVSNLRYVRGMCCGGALLGVR